MRNKFVHNRREIKLIADVIFALSVEVIDYKTDQTPRGPLNPSTPYVAFIERQSCRPLFAQSCHLRSAIIIINI